MKCKKCGTQRKFSCYNKLLNITLFCLLEGLGSTFPWTRYWLAKGIHFFLSVCVKPWDNRIQNVSSGSYAHHTNSVSAQNEVGEKGGLPEMDQMDQMDQVNHYKNHSELKKVDFKETPINKKVDFKSITETSIIKKVDFNCYKQTVYRTINK